MDRIILDAMRNESKSDRELKLDDFFASNKPSTELEHTLAYAYVKQVYSATQTEYAKLAGINDRTLRKYIAENKKAFEEELEKHKPELLTDSDELTSSLSEEQLNQFVQNMIKSAISPTATVRDREFLVNFTGLKAEDVMTLGQIKAKSLRWFIKGNLSKISKSMDVKQLGIMLQESAFTYNGDSESKGNTERFVKQDLKDEAFKQELMYFGMLFLSLYNQKAHPDLDLMATTVRLNRLEADVKQSMNKAEVKRFAKGKDIDETSVSATQDQMDAMFKELGITRESIVDVIKPPALPDVEDVEEKASDYFEELLILTSVEEEMEYMMRKIKTNKGSN